MTQQTPRDLTRAQATRMLIAGGASGPAADRIIDQAIAGDRCIQFNGVYARIVADHPQPTEEELAEVERSLEAASAALEDGPAGEQDAGGKTGGAA